MEIILFISFIDRVVQDRVVLLRGDELTAFFMFITLLGSWQAISAVVIGISILLFYKKMEHYVMPLWITFITAEVAIFILKLVIARPRPPSGILFEPDFSFPSGHAGLVVATYGFLVFIAFRHFHGTILQKYSVFFCVAIIFLVGFSRLYLGVHYVSDVLTGYLIGFFALVCGIYVHSHYGKGNSNHIC